MPHLVVQYSGNLAPHLDMAKTCAALHQAMVSSGIFPLGGIRVRAFESGDFAIADQHPQNAFIDMVLRMGAGRTLAQKQAAGESIMATAQGECAALLAEGHFALSLEIQEIDPALSWKRNSIHARLKG